MFSPDGRYLAYGHENSPLITIYERDGDVFTKLPNVSPSLNSNIEVYGLAFSLDGTYLIASHYYTPYITIYKRIDDTYTKMPNPDILPGTTAYAPTLIYGDSYLICRTTNGTLIYKKDDDTYNRYDTLTDPNNPEGYSVPKDSSYLAMAHRFSPFLTLMKLDKESIV